MSIARYRGPSDVAAVAQLRTQPNPGTIEPHRPRNSWNSAPILDLRGALQPLEKGRQTTISRGIDISKSVYRSFLA